MELPELKFSQAKSPRKLPAISVIDKDTRACVSGAGAAAIKYFSESGAWVRGPQGLLYKQTCDGLWVKSGGPKELQGLIMSKFNIKAALASDAASVLAGDKLPEVSIVAVVPHKRPGIIRLNGLSILNTRAPLPAWETPTEKLSPLLEYMRESMGDGYTYFMAAMHRYAHQIDDEDLLPSQALVIVGDYGAGKTLICRELISAILGSPSDMNENALASQFTGALFASPYVVADDALTGHKIKPATVAAKLKEITGLCEQRVEQKGKDAVQLPWSGPLIITANLGETSALPDWRAPCGEAPRLVAIYMAKAEGGPERMTKDGRLIGYIRSVRAQFAQYCYDYRVPTDIQHERYVSHGFVAPEVAAEFDERPDPARKIVAELKNGCLRGMQMQSLGDIYDRLRARDMTNRDKPPVVDKYLTERKLGDILTKLAIDPGSGVTKKNTNAGRRYCHRPEEQQNLEAF